MTQNSVVAPDDQPSLGLAAVQPVLVSNVVESDASLVAALSTARAVGGEATAAPVVRARDVVLMAVAIGAAGLSAAILVWGGANGGADLITTMPIGTP